MFYILDIEYITFFVVVLFVTEKWYKAMILTHTIENYVLLIPTKLEIVLHIIFRKRGV